MCVRVVVDIRAQTNVLRFRDESGRQTILNTSFGQRERDRVDLGGIIVESTLGILGKSNHSEIQNQFCYGHTQAYVAATAKGFQALLGAIGNFQVRATYPTFGDHLVGVGKQGFVHVVLRVHASQNEWSMKRLPTQLD